MRLAKRILALDAEIMDNTNRIGELVEASPAAALVEETGIGPVTAATVLVAWSHPGRVRDEAAFAALAGVNPIPASSGHTTRHRLNPGGDRRPVIVIIRLAAEGSSRKVWSPAVPVRCPSAKRGAQGHPASGCTLF